MTDIEITTREFKARQGDLALVVLDYVQLMSGGRDGVGRQEALSEIVRQLKLLAREVEVPILVLSQASRGLESRQDKRPVPSDLRESGSLEADADVVMFLYRDELYNQDSPDRGIVEIIVAKHRGGPCGTEKLAFFPNEHRFADIRRREPPGDVITASLHND